MFWRALRGGASIAALGGLCNGFAMGGLGGVMEESEAFKLRFAGSGGDLDSAQSESLAAAVQLGAMGGAVLAGALADRFGRRPAVVCSALLVMLGSAVPLLMPLSSLATVDAAANATAVSAELMVLRVGRLVLGLGIGAVCMVVPTLAAELAPADLRGAIDSAFQLFVAVGIVLSFLFNMQFSTVSAAQATAAAAAGKGDALWRAALALPILPSAALLLLVVGGLGGGAGICVRPPESPRWLLQYRGDEKSALCALVQVRGGDKEAASRELAEMVAAAKQRRRCSTLDASVHAAEDDEGGKGGEESTAWSALLLPRHRRAVAIACVVLWLQVFTGIDILTQYAAHVFELAGVGSRGARLGCNLAMGVVGLVATAISVPLVESSGRRPLLLWGSVAMAVSLAALAAVLGAIARGGTGSAASAVAVAMTFAYAFAFALSWGPVSWIVPCEIVPTAIRAKVLSLGVMLNWLADYVVVSTFLSLKDALGISAVFLLYATVCTLAWLFVYLCVVESKGLSLEQITVIMHQGARAGGGGSAGAEAGAKQEQESEEKSSLLSHGIH